LTGTEHHPTTPILGAAEAQVVVSFYGDGITTMYTTTTNYGFTTCVGLRFHSSPEEGHAERVGASVQAFLNVHSHKIRDLAGVSVRRTPSVNIDGDVCSLPLELHTDRDLPLSDKLRLAKDVVDFARANLNFPEISEVLDDGAPPVATCGF
jgi:hypothetical protein